MGMPWFYLLFLLPKTESEVIIMVNLKNIEYNLKPFKRTLEAIKAYNFSGAGDEALAEAAAALKARSLAEEADTQLLPESFALTTEAVKRSLGLTPHDNQLLAASAMARGDIIELATGEGKTLSAVFTACLKALGGEGVHVLTFNDYLAARDAAWMKPVYDMLDISVSAIKEGMDPAARRRAYAADVTYLTAKEAGFDYLRGFLAFDPGEVVQRPFHFAIIDEADSTLIDEARIPLVIAGDAPSMVRIEEKIFDAVAGMQKDLHYSIDEDERRIFLEDAGADFVERRLAIGELYDGSNSDTLSKVNVTLQAKHMLKRDVDYIVKDGEILIVDAFTGRVALNRQWSDGLHAAVELKEGLSQKMQGRILNSITLQSFLRLYPDFCGMTGTACPAAAELMKFYDRSVTVIPSHKPCIRVDHPDVMFADGETKFRAVADAVIKAHDAGRPVLVGTASVAESERLAGLLRGMVPGASVLNAKNDAEEARVIADAGRPGAVTISTNMAGRGVDIRLGGQDGAGADAIRALGGLLVIWTNRHESVRIDSQLRGRAGRQGDPGESRFFISLEDSLFTKYGLLGCAPEKLVRPEQDTPLKGRAVAAAVLRTQRYAEVQTFDAKTTLFKYAAMVESQRRIVQKKREDILFGRTTLAVLEKERPEKHQELLGLVPENEFLRAQKQISLYALGKCWSDHLLYVEGLRDELLVLGKVRGDPLTRYSQRLIEGLDALDRNVRDTVLSIYDGVIVEDGRIDLERMGIRGPTSTRTYLVHDGTENDMLLGNLGVLGPSGLTAPLYLLNMMLEKRRKQKRG
jgi:preprotein translocase subunit SecA